MPQDRLLLVGLLLASTVLGGCATNRSELRLTSPAAIQAMAEKADGPSVPSLLCEARVGENAG